MCASHLPSECSSWGQLEDCVFPKYSSSVSGSLCLYANMPVPNKRDSRFLLPLNLDRICNSLIKTSQVSCFMWFLKLEWKGAIFLSDPKPHFSPSVLVLRVQLPCCEDVLHQSLCLSALASTRQLASLSAYRNGSTRGVSKPTHKASRTACLLSQRRAAYASCK